MKQTLWLSRDKSLYVAAYILWKHKPTKDLAGCHWHGEMMFCLSPRDWAMFSNLRIRKGRCVKVELTEGFKLRKVK